jgi:hypothetical protein
MPMNGRTDRQREREKEWGKHDEAYACFSQFCERALKRWLENIPWEGEGQVQSSYETIP